MLRKLPSLFAASSATAAHPGLPDVKPDVAKIFPYVVPSSYLDEPGTPSNSVIWPLGHGLVVALVFDLGGLVRNVQPEDLVSLGLTTEQAKQRAIENLAQIAESGVIGQQRFTGPNQKPSVLFGGHWAAATCILLPGLREMGKKNIGNEPLCVCIPHRDALLMFAKGDQAYREAMVKLIKQNESGARKPLTFEFFELTASGIKEFKG